LTAEKEACPEFVPTVYFFSRPNGLMVMEYLAPPYIILRKGLIQGIRYPTMASDIGTFCAKTLFATSGFALTTTELRQRVTFWTQNHDLCALTEQVIFTEPYMMADNNRWTSPQLDVDKKAIESNVALKLAVAQWKHKFVTCTEALIHGDLHTGSVLCKPEAGATYVIDPEFAFYGPMGFDTGAFVANLLLAYVSQGGHENKEDYDEWILLQVKVFWNVFCEAFKNLWSEKHTGYLYGTYLEEAVEQSQTVFFANLLHDTLGFAGMKMLRRIVGIAHVEDLESIMDPDVRAKCERHGLEIAKVLIQTAGSFENMEQVLELARSKKP
jgi:5-methylthioribose kinase